MFLENQFKGPPFLKVEMYQPQQNGTQLEDKIKKESSHTIEFNETIHYQMTIKRLANNRRKFTCLLFQSKQPTPMRRLRQRNIPRDRTLISARTSFL